MAFYSGDVAEGLDRAINDAEQIILDIESGYATTAAKALTSLIRHLDRIRSAVKADKVPDTVRRSPYLAAEKTII